MLKFIPFAAPGRYVFPDPDTGYFYKARDKQTLIRNIINYRAQNELAPLERLSDVLDNYWCSLPENVGKCEEYKLERGWFSNFKGGVSVLRNIFFGEKGMVSQEEADRRSAICRGCQFNIFPDKSGFIAWADSHAEASTGGRKSKYHDELGNCKVCTCPLRAKVFSKKKELTEDEKRDVIPECWQLEEG